MIKYSKEDLLALKFSPLVTPPDNMEEINMILNPLKEAVPAAKNNKRLPKKRNENGSSLNPRENHSKSQYQDEALDPWSREPQSLPPLNSHLDDDGLDDIQRFKARMKEQERLMNGGVVEQKSNHQAASKPLTNFPTIDPSNPMTLDDVFNAQSRDFELIQPSEIQGHSKFEKFFKAEEESDNMIVNMLMKSLKVQSSSSSSPQASRNYANSGVSYDPSANQSGQYVHPSRPYFHKEHIHPQSLNYVDPSRFRPSYPADESMRPYNQPYPQQPIDSRPSYQTESIPSNQNQNYQSQSDKSNQYYPIQSMPSYQIQPITGNSYQNESNKFQNEDLNSNQSYSNRSMIPSQPGQSFINPIPIPIPSQSGPSFINNSSNLTPFFPKESFNQQNHNGSVFSDQLHYQKESMSRQPDSFNPNQFISKEPSSFYQTEPSIPKPISGSLPKNPPDPRYQSQKLYQPVSVKTNQEANDPLSALLRSSIDSKKSKPRS